MINVDAHHAANRVSDGQGLQKYEYVVLLVFAYVRVCVEGKKGKGREGGREGGKKGENINTNNNWEADTIRAAPAISSNEFSSSVIQDEKAGTIRGTPPINLILNVSPSLADTSLNTHYHHRLLND